MHNENSRTRGYIALIHTRTDARTERTDASTYLFLGVLGPTVGRGLVGPSLGVLLGPTEADRRGRWTYFRTNRRLYGLTVGGPNSRANRPKDERADERLDGRLDERLDSQLGGRTVGRTDGWTASWADGQLGGRTVFVSKSR